MNRTLGIFRIRDSYLVRCWLVALAATGVLPAADIYPGTNIQSVVNASPAGTVYVLKSGMHRLQSVTPKNGDVFQGEAGTVLNGSVILTSFVQQGSYWMASGQTQQGAVNTAVPCQSGWQGCQYPEQLFFDDALLQHVETLAQIGPGKWYFDYAANNIYLYDNPTGHKVETSITPRAFLAGGNNVTIMGMTIEKYASPTQDSAVVSGTGWVVQNCEIRLNHGMAVRLGTGTRILSNYIHDNGQIGVTGAGDNILVDGNEIAYNNRAHFDFQGTNSEAGGTKFNQTNYLVASNNYVHDNGGPGLWVDGNNYLWTFESNRLANNMEAGVLDEISYDGTVRFNVLENEGSLPNPNQTSFWYRGGILNAGSPNEEIYGNTLINCLNGIGAIANNRGSGNRGTFLVQNLYIHDNTIVQSGGYAAGIVADAAYIGAYTSQNNRFVKNSYKLANPSGLYYQWSTGGNYIDMSSSQWIAAGEDTSGTWLPPTSPIPSTQFASGARVELAVAAAVRSLPTSASPSVVVSNLAAGSQGTVTNVRGPIYADGECWWQVLWDSGARGWTPVSVMRSAISDTTPPSVSISSPASNSSVSGVISVTAVATDNVSVTKVEFYLDGVLTASSTAAPWGFTWDTTNTSPGTHALTAKAYDAAGNSGLGTVSVTVVAPDTVRPTVGISYPYNNSTVSGVLSVTVVATDNVGVTKVEFYIDGVLTATKSAAPWTFTWDTTRSTPGTHTLLAKGYDAAGNSDGGVVSVTVLSGTVGPLISSVSATAITADSARISWSTDVVSDSQVDYGTSVPYSSSSTLNPALVTSHSVDLSGLSPATTYHYRVKSKNTGGLLSTSSDFTVTTAAASASYSLSANPTSVVTGGSITVSWTTPPGASTYDWIALYPTGAANTGYVAWRYTGGTTAGSFSVSAPASAGTYEFRYLLNNGYTDVARSNVVTVGAGSFSLTATPPIVSTGSTITVSWSATPGHSAHDWIGLFLSGAGNTQYVWWTYTGANISGVVPVTAPNTPGTYEFRYLLNDGYADAARSSSITVR